MRILFLTPDSTKVHGSGYFSNVASTRWSAIYPAKWLASREVETSIACYKEPYESVLESARRAHRVVLGKLMIRNGESSAYQHQTDIYLRLISECGAPEGKFIHVVGDNVFDSPNFHRLVNRSGQAIRCWYAASEAIAVQLRSLSNRPVAVVPECYESTSNRPQAPRYGIGRRIFRFLTRHGVDLNGIERVRLAWFGHVSNIQALIDALPDLHELGREIPLHLHCVSAPDHGLEAVVAGAEFPSTGLPLRVTFEPWSIEASDRALAWCEAAIIPYDMRDKSKVVKSNNRLIAVLRAGRLAIASPIPSMSEMERYAWIGEPMSGGLRWAFKNSRAAIKKVREGQNYVERHHSPEVITAHWKRLLGLA